MANSLSGGQDIARQTLVDRLLDAVKQVCVFYINTILISFPVFLIVFICYIT